jgi:hypothetical protein
MIEVANGGIHSGVQHHFYYSRLQYSRASVTVAEMIYGNEISVKITWLSEIGEMSKVVGCELNI